MTKKGARLKEFRLCALLQVPKMCVAILEEAHHALRKLNPLVGRDVEVLSSSAMLVEILIFRKHSLREPVLSPRPGAVGAG
jgi:hypothetical protein